jgi:hypothetical protein
MTRPARTGNASDYHHTRMRIVRSWKVLSLVACLALGASAVALAEPVQLFSFQVKDLKPGGRFTLIFNARTFDTTGAVPPNPTENYLRLPAGSTLRKEFLTRRWFCDGTKLRNDITRDIDPRGTPFYKRVADLRPFIRRMSRSRSSFARKALANARVCHRARIGSGTARIDARDTIPVLDQLIPSYFSMFFSRPSRPGAIAGFTVVGAADETAPIVRKYPIVAGVHVALRADFFNDPTPDGLYGYRLQLPTGEVGGLEVSIAELSVRTTGLTLARGTCLKTRGGRCVKRQPRTIFWFTTPPCPPSGSLSIQNFFGYADPQPDITRTIQLACPRFQP